MRMRRAAGWLLLPGLFLVACSSPPRESPVVAPPVQAEPPPVRTGEEPPTTSPEKPPKPPQAKAVAARFHLYTGLLGFKLPDARRELNPGETAVTDLAPFDLDVLLPGMTEQQARQALKVDGAQLLAEPDWLAEGGLALQIGPGQPEQVVTVRVEAAGLSPAILKIRRAAPATVTIDQRFGHGWRPITVLDAYTTPGPSAVRLNFSKPVRREEVEQALLAAQSVPIRGLMEWADDKTLTWQIAELPPRLDFLLGGAHDADGLPLPGGIPSLRLGDPPILVEVDLANPADLVRGTLPPDIITAQVASTRKAVNLIAWTPGTTRWDWQTVDVYFDLEQKQLKRGRVEAAQPRLPPDVEHGVISPNGALVAGLRSKGQTAESFDADLVVLDIRGGRSQTFPGVIGRFRGEGQVDLTTHLAWSPDSAQVAALSYAGNPRSAELVVVNLASRQRTVLVPDLPVRSDGTHLAWSTDGRFLLAGHLLIDLQTRAVTPLPGDSTARGFWEPAGRRLLYSPADWKQLFIVDPVQGEVKPLGDGLIVGWSAPGRVMVVRWPGSDTRYLPPGQ
ncbi:MAG: hypothetical protein ACOY93_17125 [Bacillota bacterium]